LLIENITPVIIAKNAEETIFETLNSLISFEEVILYLNNSTDTTKNIAQKYSNVKIIQGDFLGFGPTKNKAATYSSNEWILSLDSDEVLDEKLTKEIGSLNLKNEKIVYELKRDNYFLGKKVNYSGWGKDYLHRIYNKNYHSLNDNLVHEFLRLKEDASVVRLKNSFKHNAVQKISQQLQKMDSYSTIYATEKRCKKKSTPFIAILKSIFFFIKTYFFKLGFLDSTAGLLISISGANGVFYKYMKLYEENKKCK